MARTAVSDQKLSIRFVCECYSISESGYRYKSKSNVENERIADWLLRLTQTHKRWGFGLCFLYLRNVKGFTWNHKRVHRIYRELELNLRIKLRRRITRDKPVALGLATAINQVWSMDFMRPAFWSDSLVDDRLLRTFNVIDDYSHKGLGIEVDLSLPSSLVVRSPENIIEWRGQPSAIKCDNGPEHIAQAVVDWATENQITLLYIQPGEPTQNAYAGRFNRTARHEWFDLHDFNSVEHAQQLGTRWL